MSGQAGNDELICPQQTMQSRAWAAHCEVDKDRGAKPLIAAPDCQGRCPVRTQKPADA